MKQSTVLSLCPVLEEKEWQEFNLMSQQMQLEGARAFLLVICYLVRSCLPDDSECGA